MYFSAVPAPSTGQTYQDHPHPNSLQRAEVAAVLPTSASLPNSPPKIHHYIKGPKASLSQSHCLQSDSDNLDEHLVSPTRNDTSTPSLQRTSTMSGSSVSSQSYSHSSDRRPSSRRDSMAKSPRPLNRPKPVVVHHSTPTTDPKRTKDMISDRWT